MVVCPLGPAPCVDAAPGAVMIPTPIPNFLPVRLPLLLMDLSRWEAWLRRPPSSSSSESDNSPDAWTRRSSILGGLRSSGSIMSSSWFGSSISASMGSCGTSQDSFQVHGVSSDGSLICTCRKEPTSHLNAGRTTETSQVLHHNALHPLEIRWRVHVLRIGRLDIELVIRPEILIILVDGDVLRQICQWWQSYKGTADYLLGPSSTPVARPVSYAHARLTFRMVYPPPPSRSSGLLNDLTNLTQFACPFPSL